MKAAIPTLAYTASLEGQQPVLSGLRTGWTIIPDTHALINRSAPAVLASGLPFPVHRSRQPQGRQGQLGAGFCGHT